MKQNIHSSILVAVDMGSQTFRSMAAEMTPSGALRVLGVEESSQKRCVHHGQIENTGDAGYMLNSIIKLSQDIYGKLLVFRIGYNILKQIISQMTKRWYILNFFFLNKVQNPIS